jgi:putative flippase GtrA
MTTTVDFPTVDFPDAVDDESTPPVMAAAVAAPFHHRARHAIRRPDNWRQLFRFLCVGTTGYMVNLAVFAASVHVLSIDYKIASVIAFVFGCANNFWWNRHWTFDASHHHPAKQGMRFLLVSLLVFGFAYVILVGLVHTTGMDKVLAQAIANVAATPLSFVAQKLWSFQA